MGGSPEPVDSQQFRVEFDAEVTFSNGGGLTAREFRLDIAGCEISDTAIGELLVAHLGLLMVGGVEITRKRVLREPHKGSRGVAAAEVLPRRVVDLAGPRAVLRAAPRQHLALVDLPGVLLRIRGSADQLIHRLALTPLSVAGAAVLIDGDPGAAKLTDSAMRWLVEQGAALVGGTLGDDDVATGSLPLVTGLTNLDLLPAALFRVHVLEGRSGRGPEVYAVVT